MNIVVDTEALARFCAEAAGYPYVTVDTEFLRERTYYAQLCLVQIARPGKGDEGAVLVDTLSEKLSLEPLYELFRNRNVVKVFHAARQDLEIFQTTEGVLPAPFFDTQVAAMVCGYGDQVGYETLVRQIARAAGRQVLAVHRLEPAAAQPGADDLCPRRRHPPPADLRGAGEAARGDRPQRLGRGGGRGADRPRDLPRRARPRPGRGSRRARRRRASSRR